jgi:hypothetical protein
MMLVLFGLVLWAFKRASSDDRIDWIDTITSVNQVTGRVEASITKILQIVGGITGTFIVTKLTLQNAMTWDIFAIYLAYVASIDGFSKFILAKYGVTNFTPVVAPVAPTPAPAPVVTTTTTTVESAPGPAPKPVDDQ